MNSNIVTPEPEKLNLWDRFFNRYRRVVVDRGVESWTRYEFGDPHYQFARIWVEYQVIDRVTGSYTIERDYLT